MPHERDIWRPTPTWLVDRAKKHHERIRQGGLTSVAVSDARRLAALLRRYAWRARHDSRPNAVPVFVVGIQRSGTDMLIMAFKESPETEVHNEAMDTRAFSRWALRSDPTIKSIVESSRHRAVVFKSLLDSHRIVHLMTELGTAQQGRSVWIYRSMEGRVRSTLARWPENNHRVLREIAAGEDRWEARGLPAEHLELVRNLDFDELSRESAAALLWYLRNSLFFNLGLESRPDVALLSYERVLSEPEHHIRLLCDFAGVRFNSRMVGGIAPRPPATQEPLEIDPQIQSLCTSLYERLEESLGLRLSQGRIAGANPS